MQEKLNRGICLENLKLTNRSEHAKLHYSLTPEQCKKGAIKLRLPHTKTHFTCSKCHKLRPKKDFWKDKRHWNGLQEKCKECRKKYYIHKENENDKTKRICKNRIYV
jgi:CRISPR/Cas system-associated protein Cas10 (large subunit of type III CRISPR-Cas system)